MQICSKFCFALLIGFVLIGTAVEAQAERRFAIVIGANAGWANDRPLRYAETDAERVRDVLVELGGFSSDRVVLLRDPETSIVRSELRKLAEHLRGINEQTTVFFYYSGHSDQTNLHLRGSALTYNDLEVLLRKMPASVRIGVLDSCQSGSIANKGGKRTDSFRLSTQAQARVRGLVLVSSSGADELSQESRALAGSVFTHHLVSGLRGAADTDGNEQVSLHELYRYTFERTAADTSSSIVQQTPNFRFDLRGQGQMILSQLNKRMATLLLPVEPSRRYVVVDQQEWKMIAESRSSPKRTQLLAIAPGNYRIKRIDSTQIAVASFSLQQRQLIKIDELQFESVPLNTGVLKGSPLDLNSSEYREWQRGKALARLAAGKPSAALVLFDNLLAQWPGDTGALRGRAKALIRLAESYDKLGDHVREQSTLLEAIDSDPSLSEDPDFRTWYRRNENERQKVSEEMFARQMVQMRRYDTPRHDLLWGVELELVSAKAVSSLTGSVLLNKRWMPYFSLDLKGTGLGAGLRFAALTSAWSPFVSAGAHVSFETMGLAIGEEPMGAQSEQEKQMADEEWEARFGRSFNAEVGVQYLGGIGFAMTIGYGFVLTPPHEQGEKVQVRPYPTIAFGWYFR